MELKKQATIKIHFGAQGRNPTNEDVFTFFKKQKWSAAELCAMYREDFGIFVRFQSDVLMRKALKKLGAQETFVYADGTTTRVSIFEASGAVKYVRIFGLPPEIGDTQIADVMSKYGKIQGQVRERYGEETGFPIWSGVRGLFMEVRSDIPARLQVLHVEARIYYDGLKNTCFGCGKSGHLKVACPKRIKEKEKNKEPSSNETFANVLIHGKSGSMEMTPGSVEEGVKQSSVVKEKNAKPESDKAKSVQTKAEDHRKFLQIFDPEKMIIPPFREKNKPQEKHRRSRSRSPRKPGNHDQDNSIS